MNWKGKPLETYQTIINLIGGTKTKKGLKIEAKLDNKQYEKGIKITNQVIKTLNVQPHQKHPKWNYTISDNTIKCSS